eukprot:2730887-Amphidinium_carterae.1
MAYVYSREMVYILLHSTLIAQSNALLLTQKLVPSKLNFNTNCLCCRNFLAQSLSTIYQVSRTVMVYHLPQLVVELEADSDCLDAVIFRNFRFGGESVEPICSRVCTDECQQGCVTNSSATEMCLQTNETSRLRLSMFIGGGSTLSMCLPEVELACGVSATCPCSLQACKLRVASCQLTWHHPDLLCKRGVVVVATSLLAH